MTSTAIQTQAPPWWTNETALRVSDIPKILPAKPDGSRVHISSAFRFTTAGVSGVRIRRFKCGSVWCTTQEEVRRWERALTVAAGGDL